MLDPVQPLPSWPLAGSNLSYLIAFLPGGFARFAIFRRGPNDFLLRLMLRSGEGFWKYVQRDWRCFVASAKMLFAVIMTGLSFY